MFLAISQIVYSQEIKKIRLNPAQAFGGQVSDFFQDIEYIPLETTRESLFGEAINFIVTDSSYIFFDPDTNCLLFFSKSGKFLRKRKYPASTWPEISPDLVKKKIYTRYRNQTEVVDEVFDFLGNSLDLKKMKENSKLDVTMYEIRLSDSVYIKNNSCYYTTYKGPQNTVINSVEIFKNNKLVNIFMPINQKWSMAYCGLSPGPIVNVSSSYDGNLYLSTTFTHYIYKYENNSFQPMFQLIFPSERTVPKSYIESNDLKFIDSLRKIRWVQSDNIIIRIRNISFGKDCMFFKIDPGKYVWAESSVANAQYNFIYNLKTARLVSFERIKPDTTSYYLPISNGPRTSVDGVFNYRGYSFNPISSLRMFNAYHKEKTKNIQYPAELKSYFETQNRRSNPVIVKMKLKE